MLSMTRIRELQEVSTPTELIGQVHEMLASIGLEHFLFSTIYHKNGQIVREAISRWPTPWFPMYYSGAYFDHNPCVEHVRKDRNPINILDVPLHTEKHHELFEQSIAIGVRSGALAAVSETKPKLGILCACSSDDRRGTETTINRHLPLFPIIANAVYEAFERIQMLTRAIDAEASNPFQLSRKEILALMWAAEGLSNLEIAMKLNRQVTTVKKHLLSAREHLGAINTAHAVAIAMRHGIID